MQLYKVIPYTVFVRPVRSCYISQCKLLSGCNSNTSLHLPPLSGCRLPGEARPPQRVGGQEEVLANPVGGGVLSQPQHRPQRPEGGESTAGRPHEHQNCRYRADIVEETLISDNSCMNEKYRVSAWSHLVLIHCLPWCHCRCSSKMS